MSTLTAPKQTRRRTPTRRAARRGIGPEDLLRLQFVATPRISPDGRNVVLVKKHVGAKNDYVTNLWMVSREGPDGLSWGAPRQFTNGSKDTNPRWSPDG
ncbi:MAG: PD40 domain-containing protein [Proteobacteria bacterium]|nr:PD40 domain-containing protein [Pseudomonadota bacterium]